MSNKWGAVQCSGVFLLFTIVQFIGDTTDDDGFDILTRNRNVEFGIVVYIGFFIPNPLIGENIDELGVRFPDMSEVYDKSLRAVLRTAAEKNGIDLKEGVYVQYSGPSFETPADIRMLGRLGADAVGMSTVVEAMAARHCGLRVCAVSCIANKAAGISPTPLSGEEVIEAANAAAPRFQSLLWDSVAAMHE